MNPKKIYLSRFRRAIPFAFPNKRSLTRQVNQMLDDYLEIFPNATLDQMMADLGKPEDTAQSYLQNNEQDKVRHVRRKYIGIAAIIIAILVFAFGAFFIHVYYHWPAVIVYETPVEITDGE